MSREEYIAYKTQGQFPQSFLYNYYLEKCTEKNLGNCIDETLFYQIISTIFPTKEGAVMFQVNLALARIIEEYDKKFDIKKVMDKDDNLIKFY